MPDHPLGAEQIMMPFVRTRFVLIVTFAGVAGCGDAAAPTAAENSRQSRLRPALTTRMLRGLPDSDYLVAASEARGFAGLHFDDSGALVMSVSHDANAAMARAASERLLSRWGEPRRPSRVRTVNFAFDDLAAWMDALAPIAFSELGATLVDVDEVRNQIFVGVVDPSASVRARLDEYLSELSIPGSAVALEALPMPKASALLTDRVRPVIGGLSVYSTAPGVVDCTAGPIVSFVGGTERFFLTASHCTQLRAQLDNTGFHQASYLAQDFVGTEYADPPTYTSGDCPVGYSCRKSDAALVRFVNPSYAYRGRVVRTTFSSPTQGSKVIAGHWDVYGSTKSYIVGMSAHKMGQSSGWTTGTITRTCALAQTSGSSIVYTCQHVSSAATSSGDSGGPVFSLDSQGRFIWLGITIALEPQSEGTIFSPANNISAEFGPLYISP